VEREENRRWKEGELVGVEKENRRWREGE